MEDELEVMFADGVRRKRYLRPKRIVRECSVLEWVKIQNAKGLSPSGPAIYEKLMEVHPARRHSDVEPLAHMSQQGRSYARQWLLRLRKRVRLIRGRFKPGPALSQEAMRKKACAHTRVMIQSRPCPETPSCLDSVLSRTKMVEGHADIFSTELIS